MTISVAINGFGRIGRGILRAVVETGRMDIRIVAINDLAPIETNAHLLRYDSVHGRFPAEVKIDGDTIDIGQGPIAFTALRDPSELPWSDVDVVLECTGVFKDRDACQMYLDRGARRVLISAPGKGVEKTVVYGVNHDTLNADDLVVSNASCTTNCLAPVAQVLDDAVGIVKGFMTTVHSYTGDQPTLDTAHSDLYRARAAALSMIPTSTGAARAVGLVLPKLDGKLDGVAIRVPTPNVSAVDLTFEAAIDTTVEAINDAFIAAAQGPLKGVMDYTDAPLVSADFNHDSHSAVLHLDQTRVLGGNMVRVLAWYDNEWAFANRMLDTAAVMGGLIPSGR